MIGSTLFVCDGCWTPPGPCLSFPVCELLRDYPGFSAPHWLFCKFSAYLHSLVSFIGNLWSSPLSVDFWAQTFFTPKLFSPQFLLTQKLFDRKLFWSQTFLTPKFFLTLKIIFTTKMVLTPNFFLTPKLLTAKIFLSPNFILSQKFFWP